MDPEAFDSNCIAIDEVQSVLKQTMPDVLVRINAPKLRVCLHRSTVFSKYVVGKSSANHSRYCFSRSTRDQNLCYSAGHASECRSGCRRGTSCGESAGVVGSVSLTGSRYRRGARRCKGGELRTSRVKRREDVFVDYDKYTFSRAHRVLGIGGPIVHQL